VAHLGSSDLDVFGLCLGGNVFGWTADEAASFAVLDAYHAGGGNFIDTADTYSGGRSETTIGRWMSTRDVRDQIVIATKVGSWTAHPGLSADNIHAAVKESLARLQVDQIQLYYAHRDDPTTPLAETLRAFDELTRSGAVRAFGLSNYSAGRLAEALATCDDHGFARPVALQPQYSLVERDDYEGPLGRLCGREGLACLPYFALARGFLTGKYRPGVRVDSARAAGAEAYLADPRAEHLLKTLDEIAAAHQSSVAAVAIAWLRVQPTVVAPIASARTAEQLADILPGASLELSDTELKLLTDAWPSRR
jgi:aryl-alcohol dehydrogenase-like predicted oxidoreductase